MEKKPMETKPVDTKPAAHPAAEHIDPKSPAKSAPSKGASAPRRRKLSKKQQALRKKRIRRAALLASVLILVCAAALTAFFMTSTVIGGQIYPLTVQKIDLRGQGLTSVKGVARLEGLTEALLSDNDISDASPLMALTECEYIDLTGNPVSADSCARLKAALPDCLILCEAADGTTQEMALGGYDLPGADVLARVFTSHHALKTVDLRGTTLSAADADALAAQFPHINFVYPSDGSADTAMLSLSSASEAAQMLAGMPGATHVTITGCTFAPEEYRALKAQFPGVTLDCRIDLYGVQLLSGAAEIDLSRAQTDETLEENLRLFDHLQQLTLGETMPTEAARLRDSLQIPSLRYRYNGCLISAETIEIDLYGAPGLNAAELDALLAAMPQLSTVVMNKPDEAMLTVMAKYEANVGFFYQAEAFGRTFSTSDRTLDLGDAVTDADVGELMALINRMPNLEELTMYESKLSQESMDLLFDSYPDIFFGWTFRMCDGRYVVRSDVTAFSTLLGSPSHFYTQKDFVQLRYCKNLLALDLGHNAITNIDFLYNFPNLELLILADNQISDITPIASLKNLGYLEIFLNYDIKDYSPLAGLPLTDLNIRCSRGVRQDLDVEDFLAIPTLKRFWASKGHLDAEEIELMREQMPDCEIVINNESATKDGWRENGIYPIIVRMFDTRQYEPVR